MKPIHFTLLGWVIMLYALTLVNKTKTGHTLIFYSLVLILIFLVVFNYQRIYGVIIKKEVSA